MSNRLAGAISPYLRSHAENPVDWFPWGEEAFATARERNVPVLVSIGYSTCHWCHVMARETFSDPVLAASLNARFVAIKVDREEHPEVDAAYLAAAGAFTPDLGWPLNVFVTPEGRPFYAGTYSPPAPVQGHPSFGQVLAAVTEAWTERNGEVLDSAAQLTAALAASTTVGPGGSAGAVSADGAPAVPEESRFAEPVAELAAYEDERFGGFGGAPKFPVAPVLSFLLAHDGEIARPLAERTLAAMAASPLRDPIEGGFFRYATARDWSDPHYERMLYDNALLLDAYTTVAARDPEAGWAREAAAGIAAFLGGVLQLPAGGFASAQDSESVVDGTRTEGGYYRLDAADRARQTPPALDRKVLAGWNGLAIGALARAGFTAGRPEWIASAERAAEHLLAVHHRPDGSLVRVSIDGRLSSAAATLEDYGMLAGGLLRLAAVTGAVRWAVAGRELVDAVLAAGVRAPGGGDPLLEQQGLAVALDPSEGAYPSGLSAIADACLSLYALTAEAAYRDAASRALAPLAETALRRPIAFGATLELLLRLVRPFEQLVLVEPDGDSRVETAAGSPADPAADELREAVRRWPRGLVARADDAGARMLADAGFELFADRTSRAGHPAAYRCRDFVCRLPATTAAQLQAAAPGGFDGDTTGNPAIEG